jgi:2-dehydropantoate 2-reductase
LLASEVRKPFDLIILTCKSYDLDSAIDALAPGVGPETAVIPLLNGMRHLDVLDARLGTPSVLGGQCLISARLNAEGHVEHRSDIHALIFGARGEDQSARAAKVAAALGGARFDARQSAEILLEMWEKWVFLATMAGITCLTRAALGDVVAVGGADLTGALLEECRAIATGAGFPPRADFMAMALARLTAAGSTTTASTLVDLERGGRTEADHILGDLLQRRGPVHGADLSLLRIVYTAVKASENRIAREGPPDQAV